MWTAKAQKTPSKNATVQEGTEFSFNESGNRPLALTLSGEECIQFFRDDLIQHRRFGSARAVCDASGHDGVASSNPASNSPPNIINDMALATMVEVRLRSDSSVAIVQRLWTFSGGAKKQAGPWTFSREGS